METNYNARHLDLVEVAHMDQLYPHMFCHLELDGDPDRDRLRGAVERCAALVPQLLHPFNRETLCWVDKGFTAADSLSPWNGGNGALLRWDLERDTQLKLFLGSGGRVVVGLSHLLSDGVGFLQLLYLLAACYNGEEPEPELQNNRELNSILKRVKRPGRVESPLKAKVVSFPFAGDAGNEAFCLTSTLSAGEMARLGEKAKGANRTLNDVFLAAYARATADTMRQIRVVLPCPADLRRFAPQEGLSIANFTGMYRVALSVDPGTPFDHTMDQVHNRIRELAAARRCFAGMRRLRTHASLFSPAKTVRLIRKKYSILPISYTNVGSIDRDRLALNGLSVKHCFVTGAWRRNPDYQLTVSSYGGECTLSCTLVGAPSRVKLGQRILEMVRAELIGWLEEE